VAAMQVAGPIVVAGHSAGGHLAARMGNPDRSALIKSRIRRVIPISPLSDLAPLMQTKMNTDLHLDAKECASESPARHPLTCAAHIWVGAQERPAFLWQARTLSENWASPWTVAPDKHHFNVIDDLCDPNSVLMKICLNGL
jgi:arylformamidase